MQQYLSNSSRSFQRTSLLRTSSCRLLLFEAKALARFQSTTTTTSSSTTTRTAIVRRGRAALLQRRQQSNNNKRSLRKSDRIKFSSQAVGAGDSSVTLAASEGAGLGSNSGALATSHATTSAVEQPTHLSWQGARALFVASAVPMIGFGFMDNLVMIQAGQYIDSTLGVKFGLATMTAAACGQVVSDVSGVLCGGTVEAFINRWMPNPVAASLSLAQRQSTWGRYASLAGAVIGVTLGCALGGLTLFFVDLEARDRIQRAGQFKEVLTDMTLVSNKNSANVSFPCREVIVHLPVKANQKYDWQSINQEGSGEEGSHHVRMCSIDLQEDVATEGNLVIKAARQQEILVHGQRLYAPIMRWEENKHDEIWAVVEFEKDGVEVTESDIKKVETMSSHLGIFLHRMAD